MEEVQQSSQVVRVLVVDDHELFRQGVRAMLSRYPEIDVVDEAANGKVAIEKCKEHMPDVILMDINMPVCGGLEATREIKRENPYVKILILTASETEETLFEAVKSGASGYVLKNASPAVVAESVMRVNRGNPSFPGTWRCRLSRNFPNPPKRSLRGNWTNSRNVKSRF